LVAWWITPEILQKLWDLAEEAQITEEMYNKGLLATDNKGWTVCHFAVEIYNFVALQKIWEWAIKKLTIEEVNNKLLLDTDVEGRTILHMAAECGTDDMLQNV